MMFGMGRRRRRNDSRIVFNNTSMLDVIFIILIFFISVSRLQEGWINIKLPEARASEKPSASPAPSLVIAINAEDKIMAGKRVVANERELGEVARLYATRVGTDAPVLFIADRTSRSGSLVGALKTVRDAGLTNVSFSYQPRKGKS